MADAARDKCYLNKCIFLNVYIPFDFQSSASPGRLQEAEIEKLNRISNMSASLLDLKKKQSELEQKRPGPLKDKCEIVKKMRFQEYQLKSQELQEKERDLSRQTKDLVDELVAECNDTPFHKALIKILRNLKGITSYII